MFRPIKNFITYIQKNASTTSIFGGSPTIANVNEMADVTGDSSSLEIDVNLIAGAESTKKVDMLENNKQSKSTTTTTTTTTVDDLNISLTTSAQMMPILGLKNDDNIDEAIDIETQIKSSVVMLRKPNNHARDYNARDFNQNQPFDDELEDFRHDPMQMVEDFCSVGTSDANGEETAEEFNTEDEENDDVFLELNQSASFSENEIIVLSDSELNSSITSDTPTEDPLAIDDTKPLPIEINLVSSAIEEALPNVVWIDIDSEISQPIKSPNLEKDSTYVNTSTPNNSKKPKDSIEADNRNLNIINSTNTNNNTTITVSTTTTTIINNNNNINTNTKTKLPPKVKSIEDQVEELRYDGSDSGLGSETSQLHMSINTDTNINNLPITKTTASATCTTTLAVAARKNETTFMSESSCSKLQSSSCIIPMRKAPLRSNLKRRLEDLDGLVTSADTLTDSVSDICQAKKVKRNINFDLVKVYYFQRQQGFGCVPSTGGCTLGMSGQHISTKTLTLTEHAAEVRRAHRMQEINARGSSSDDSEESEEDYLSEGSGSDLDAESNGFLQPLSPKQRRALLKAAGVRKIDPSEKIECKNIRNSREVCGCTCRDFCDPVTCTCSQAGIKCQVDRAMFPCGCSRDACNNTIGRIEFNPGRVRTHFIHTIMRLEMEKRQQQNVPLCGGSVPGLGYNVTDSASTSAGIVSSTTSPLGIATNFYNMQTQSNYSSGYASPAYTSDQTANYYQQQSSNHGYGSQDVQASHYNIDNLDTSLFSGATTTSPSYGELMPSYGNISGNTASATYHHNMNYTNTQISSYASYHHHHHHHHHHHGTTSTNYANNATTTFSSCAVPSVPPFGTATTTDATATSYQPSISLSIETTAPSCTILDTGGGTDDVVDGLGVTNNFINLNTPLASSSRLSQINDLLQNNRNTTAALIAVTQAIGATAANTIANTTMFSSTSLTSSAQTTTMITPTKNVDCAIGGGVGGVSGGIAATASINTPPIEDAQKSCLTFDMLPPPHILVLENDEEIIDATLIAIDNNTADVKSKCIADDDDTEVAEFADAIDNVDELEIIDEKNTNSIDEMKPKNLEFKNEQEDVQLKFVEVTEQKNFEIIDENTVLKLKTEEKNKDLVVTEENLEKITEKDKDLAVSDEKEQNCEIQEEQKKVLKVKEEQEKDLANKEASEKYEKILEDSVEAKSDLEIVKEIDKTLETAKQKDKNAEIVVTTKVEGIEINKVADADKVTEKETCDVEDT